MIKTKRNFCTLISTACREILEAGCRAWYRKPNLVVIMIENISPDLSSDAVKIIELCLAKLRPIQLEHLDSLVKRYPALVSGSFYLRSTSTDGQYFVFPTSTSDDEHNVVAWSRIKGNQELVCAFNLDPVDPAIVYVTVDNDMHLIDGQMQCLFASAPSPAELNVEVRNGKAIRVTIPPHALVVYS